MKILIKNIDQIYTVDEDNPFINNGYIIVEDNKICEVGKSQQITEELNQSSFDHIIDGKNKIVLPGLINTHTHSAMTLLRGYADDLPLEPWLEEKIWPVEAKLTAEDIYWGTKLAIIEMIKTGSTMFNDMYFQMDQVARAAQETGMRAVLGQGLIEENDGEEGLKIACEFAEDWQERGKGLITTLLAPHAPYTCSTQYLEKIIDASQEIKVPLHIHVAETRTEVEFVKENYGESPVRYLDNIGLFDRPTVAAHCVHLDTEEIEILSSKNVGVAYNPASNMKLASGIAPIVEMLNKNVQIGLGTDGVSSNNNLDLIEEARLGSYLQKVNSIDPTVLNIKDLLRMLTIGGANVLKIKDLGKIKEGFLADLILIDCNDSTAFYPHHNNLSNLLYAGNGNSVSTVIVNGKLIMKDKKLLTIEEEKVYYEVENRIKKLV